MFGDAAGVVGGTGVDGGSTVPLMRNDLRFETSFFD